MKNYIQPHSYVVEISTCQFLALSMDTYEETRSTGTAMSDEIDVNSGCEEDWSE